MTENRLKLFYYLIPIFGIIPALWTLYISPGDQEERKISRLSLTLAIIWLIGYISLGTGAQISAIADQSEIFGLRLLFINSVLTSGYFLCSLFLMFRVLKNRPARLPGISQLAETIFRQP
jgi:hypothetical protein